MHLLFRDQIFRDVTLRRWLRFCRRFGWTCRLNVQGFRGIFHVDYLRRRRHFLHCVGNCLVRDTSSHSTRNESSITPLFKPQNSLNCHSAYKNSVREHERGGGTAMEKWLRCCSTNRKVAGSIPAGVTGIFH